MTSPYTHDKLLRQKVEEIISKWQEGADRKVDVLCLRPSHSSNYRCICRQLASVIEPESRYLSWDFMAL